MDPQQTLDPDGSRRRICKVCVRQYANYTCPRCNLPYCSLDCYKQHGERCTESFYRDQAVTQLRGTRASADERRHMLEVLARVHAADDSISPMDMQPGSYGEAEEDEDEAGSEDSSEADAEDSDAAFGVIRSILSEATKARLRQKAQAALAEGREFEVDAFQDLTAAERAALEQLELQDSEEPAAQASSLTTAAARPTASPSTAGRVVQPLPSGQAPATHAPLVPAAVPTAPTATATTAASWVPWWLSDAARDLQLNAAGQPLVSELSTTQVGQASASTPAASTSSTSAALPQPPAEALPGLPALTKAKPSPLLRWQLLQLLFGYCMVSRLKQQEQGMDALQAAELLLALVPALDPPSAPQTGSHSSSTSYIDGSTSSGGSSGSGRPAEGASQPAALDARTALSACLARACTPPTGSAAWRQAAVMAVGDAAAIVRLGRSALVLALTDTGRMCEAAIGALKHAAGPAISGKVLPVGTAGRARAGGAASSNVLVLKQRMKAAAAKVRFFTVWANEQEPHVLQQIAAATSAEHQQQQAALSSGVSHGSGMGAVGGANMLAPPVAKAAMSAVANAAQHGGARSPGARKLVQELPGATSMEVNGEQLQTRDVPAVHAATAMPTVAAAAPAGAAAAPAGPSVAAAPLFAAPTGSVQLLGDHQDAQKIGEQTQTRTQQQPLDVFELD